ncbi:MAG: hypothetical protein Q9213_000642 [Squamulea squamosa]
MEIHNDPNDSEVGNSSAHYQPLTDATEALRKNESPMALSARASTTSDHSYISNGAENLRLINQVNLPNEVARLGAALGTLPYAGIKSAVKLQELIKCLGPALLKRLQDISAWIRAHPYRAFGIFGGITILGLTFAIPAILEVVGFGALGPVAGSIAAGWQSSLGLVAAGTPFAFLQSAAMGGAAMGVITGIGALGGAVAITAALTIKKKTVDGLVSSCKEAVGGAVEKLKSFFGKWKTH